VLGSVVMVLGALRLKGSQMGERDLESMIDACSIGLAIAVLAWQPLIEPRLTAADVPTAARLVSGSYPMFDVVVVAMMCWILLGSRGRSATAVLLVAGSAAYLFADLTYTVRIDRGTIDDPSLAWLDTIWLVAYGLFLLAVLHPSARRITRARSNDQRTITRSRLALSGLTLIAPIVALGMSGADARHLVLALSVECVLVVLVLLRLADLAAGERRARAALANRELLFRSLVQNASEALVLLKPDGVVWYASPAVGALLGVDHAELEGAPFLDTVAGLDRLATERLVSSVVGSAGMVVTGEVRFVGAMGTTWLELRLTNMLHESAVQGIVVNVHDVSARRQVQDELERRASTDPLTGLPNRTVFLDRLSEVLEPGSVPGIAVVYCDLDGFKEVNDRFGHDEGDRLLVIAAARLAGSVRSGDVLARLGGDEFAVLVDAPGACSHAETIATRIVEALRMPLVIGGESVSISVSVGVSCMSGEIDAADSLIRSADAAMYRAKRAGGDRVVISVHASAAAAPAAIASGR